MYKDATPSLLDRLMKRIDVRGFYECWPWRGKIERNGYGRIRVGGRGSPYAPSHRVAYWLLKEGGEVYADDDPRNAMEVDHTCENPLCHNPAHLQLITGHQNRWYRHHERDEHYREPYQPDEADRADMERYVNELEDAI